jgi:hypothetical protein
MDGEIRLAGFLDHAEKTKKGEKPYRGSPQNGFAGIRDVEVLPQRSDNFLAAAPSSKQQERLASPLRS